jgi:hypothetical protein
MQSRQFLPQEVLGISLHHRRLEVLVELLNYLEAHVEYAYPSLTVDIWVKHSYLNVHHLVLSQSFIISQSYTEAFIGVNTWELEISCFQGSKASEVLDDGETLAASGLNLDITSSGLAEVPEKFIVHFLTMLDGIKLWDVEYITTCHRDYLG